MGWVAVIFASKNQTGAIQPIPVLPYGTGY